MEILLNNNICKFCKKPVEQDGIIISKVHVNISSFDTKASFYNPVEIAHESCIPIKVKEVIKKVIVDKKPEIKTTK